MVNKKKEKYTINGTLVWVREHQLLTESNINKMCPLCRGAFEAGDKAKFVVNNYVLFPNCFVHVNCFNKKSPEESLRWLHKDYQGYVKILKIYECWR